MKPSTLVLPLFLGTMLAACGKQEPPPPSAPAAPAPQAAAPAAAAPANAAG